MFNLSRERWIEMVEEGMRADYIAPAPTVREPAKRFYGPPKPRHPLCFWDQNATLETPMCGKCPDCYDHYR